MDYRIKDSPFHQCDLQRTVLFYDLRADVVAARGSGNNSERNFMFTSHPILDPVSNTLILHKLKILVMLSFATHNRELFEVDEVASCENT